MKISLALFIMIFLMPFGVTSQSLPILCGNDLFSDLVRKNYPAIEESIQNTFAAGLNAGVRNNEPLIVGVVVHVVWREQSENLHDSIILDQIRILNEDFNKLNSDTSNLRPLFKPEAGSADIYFELVDIVRVQTDVEFEIDITGTNLLAEVKSDFAGGSTAHNPDQYLNIWVCKIQPLEIFGIEIGQILGFAFPPNNLPHWPKEVGAPTPYEDGVVIDFRVFGSNNPNTIENPGGGGPLDIKGRTPVHEVGHYFGLRHIWGDGGLLGPNDCAQSDGIHDTPFADSQSAFDCDITRNTCTQADSYYGQDVPDLIENYMDYSSETCMNMFTQGQVDLMRNVLLGERNGLLMPFSSIDRETDFSGFQLKPNPTSGPFTITFEITSSQTAVISLFDLHGQIIYQHPSANFERGIHQIDIPDLQVASGMYFIHIRNKNGALVEKLVVQKI